MWQHVLILLHFLTGLEAIWRHIIWRKNDIYWFLSTFGETGWFGGLATFSRTQAGRGDHVVTEGKFLNSPRPGCHPYGITKIGQEPVNCDNKQRGPAVEKEMPA